MNSPDPNLKFRRYGGLLPQFTRLVLDLRMDQLDDEDQTALRGLLDDAALDSLEPVDHRVAASDQFEYEIEFDDPKGERRTVALREADLREAQRSLVEWLVHHAQRE